jgi:hypothetical protein
MSIKAAETNMETPPTIYEIRVVGHLSPQWTDWFEGLTIMLEEDGNTLLTGPLADQAALHGLLKKVRDLGMPLVSVIQVQFHETHQHQSKKGVIKMNTNIKTTGKIDTKVLLSTLWIFIMINMAFADIIGMTYPGFMAKMVAGTPVDGMVVTPTLLLIGAFILEIPTAMILLSRLLKHGINRWVNMIGGLITIIFVMGMGSPTIVYYFFETIEVLSCLAIIWFAWKWTNPEG